MRLKTYYLRADGKWFLFNDGRWQFLATEMPPAPLKILLAHDSNILAVCRMSVEETEIFHKAQDTVHLKPELKWVLYEEEKKREKS